MTVAKAATTLFLRQERKRYLPAALEASLSALATDPGRVSGAGTTGAETSKAGLALNRAAAQRLLDQGLPQAGDEAYSTVRLGDLLPRLESVPGLARWDGLNSGLSESGPLAGEIRTSLDWLTGFLAQVTDTAGLVALAYAPVQIRSLKSLTSVGNTSNPGSTQDKDTRSAGSHGNAPGNHATTANEIRVTFAVSGSDAAAQGSTQAHHQVAAAAFTLGENQSSQLGLSIEVTDAMLANTFVAIHVQAHASLDLWVSEPAHATAQSLTQIVIRQEAGSRLRLHLGTVGNALARSAVHVELAGIGAQAEILGTAALTGKRQAHRHVHVAHRMPQATSKQLFKTVATDSARSSVDGTIEVAPLAKGTLAGQTLRNLLLSETARVDSKPRLLIRNDDVKCNHGATTGQLDENQLFYLRSRGLSLTQATALLTGAFLHETLDVVSAGTHRSLIESVLPQLLSEVRP